MGGEKSVAAIFAYVHHTNFIQFSSRLGITIQLLSGLGITIQARIKRASLTLNL